MAIEDTAHGDHATTRDHWWWRPGWSVGKSFYTWHITFAAASPVRQSSDVFEQTLSALPTMQPVSADGLHITVQGIGFTDTVAASDADRIIDAARRSLAELPRFTITVGPPIIDSETIQLPIADPGPLSAVRNRLQDAIAEVRGPAKVPEQGSAFRPHLTVSYSTGVAPIEELRKKLEADRLAGYTVTDVVAEVSLIELNRDNGRYEWREVSSVALR
ncbi:2'-5' RNA ligase family protein [Nocardia asteroides]|uniref:2'-5' RNA ligase family protein n=1 Tax=Nocardia asteroides TaxID=1824 RepID=UPI001E4B38E6|nr:2'-5' RNA ligase family protein [Nocardia asteroides]UGT59774.1 2'-5' RNA ligase family protein [Nocardia asteroides]